MDKIQDQIGYLLLTEDGAILESSGQLENDERVAYVITELVTLSNRVDPVAFSTNELFKKISITYEDHCLIICLSNKKIHIVKKALKQNVNDPPTVNA